MSYLGNVPRRYDGVSFVFTGKTGNTLTGYDVDGKQLSVITKNHQLFLNGTLLVEGVNYTVPNSGQISFIEYSLVSSDYIQIIGRATENNSVISPDYASKAYMYTGLTGSVITGPDVAGKTLSITSGSSDLYLNGVLLSEGRDYVIPNSSTINLVEGSLSSDDYVVIRKIAYQTRYSLASGTKSEDSFTIQSTASGVKPSLVLDHNGTFSKIQADNGKVTIENLYSSGVSVDAFFSTPANDFRNKIINGNFDVWQRAASQTSNGYGSDDRWNNAHVGSTKTHSQGFFTVGHSEIPGNPVFYSRTVVSSVAGAGNYVVKTQRVEGVVNLSGKKTTFTFWARADANKNIAIEVVQTFGTGGSGFVNIPLGIIALTTSWKKYNIVFDNPSILGKTLGGGNCTELVFWFDGGSNFSTRSSNLGQQSGTFDIARVSWVEGDATSEVDPFTPRHYAQEFALCQRYYQVIHCTGRFYAVGGSQFFNANVSWMAMRTTPSTTFLGLENGNGLQSYALLPINHTGARFEMISSGAGDIYAIAAYYGISAEI